jgi:hypothetical protein
VPSRAVGLFGEALRVAVAVPAAAAAAAGLFIAAQVIVSWLSDGTPFFEALGLAILLGIAAFFVALAHAVVLGIPAFLVLRWLGWTRWWASPLAGFAIGSLPYAILFSPLRGEAADFYQAGDKILVQNGVATLAGWIAYGETAGALGLFGLVGGLAAWLTWYWLGRAFAGRGAAGA